VTRSSVLLALAFGLSLSLAACGGGDDEGSAAGTGSDSGSATSGDVKIEAFAFKPGTVTVPAGTTVTWSNADSAAHTVKPNGNLFPESPNILGETTFDHTYDAAGSFPYVCGIHNYMTGTVVVS